MRVKLLYFGVLKDLLAESDAATDLPDGSTVGELLRIFRGRTSNSRAGSEMTEQVWSSLAVAVNREYAAAGAMLREGDEVALLPPVSGGVTRAAKGSRRPQRPATGHGDNDR
jgi:molybdopterin converting factor small subunit